MVFDDFWANLRAKSELILLDFLWKIMDLKYLDLELEAHTWWFCSTHVYYKTTKYELPTPSLSTSNPLFSTKNPQNRRELFPQNPSKAVLVAL